jgi:hypothetical protein
MPEGSPGRGRVTTIAQFIATLDREITTIFRDVLLICDEAGPPH